MKHVSVGLCLVCWLGAVPLVLGQWEPGGIDTVDITRIVPDTVASDFGEAPGALGNWEPYISVLGDTTFLIQNNTFAEGTTDKQRYALLFQNADGGAPLRGECFFADNGTPYKGEINLSRQNGNPGRVAGDKRLGARFLVAGGEVSLHGYPSIFGTLPPGPTYAANERYGAAQLFSFDPLTMTQTMASEAFDVLTGLSGTPASVPEVSRFGGEMAALSNGNFLVVVDDRSKLGGANYRTPRAIIVKRDGTVVKAPFPLWPGPGDCQIWSNVAAYKGGFVARCNGFLRFFDNDGNFLGDVDQATGMTDMLGNPWDFDRGRGDGTRIAGHINSPYVFLAGRQGSGETGRVMLAAYDSRTRSLVARINVNELTEVDGGTDPEEFKPGLDRVTVTCDALNRVVVAYEINLSWYVVQQVAVRVLNFNEGSKKFTYLTRTFSPFVNWLNDFPMQGAPIVTFRPSVAMTTRAICVAAKGSINTDLQPDQGANTPSEVNFYTVISHPDPKDDPTPRAYPADLDQDGDVDVNDFAIFQLCFNGASRPPACP